MCRPGEAQHLRAGGERRGRTGGPRPAGDLAAGDVDVASHGHSGGVGERGRQPPGHRGLSRRQVHPLDRVGDARGGLPAEHPYLRAKCRDGRVAHRDRQFGRDGKPPAVGGDQYVRVIAGPVVAAGQVGLPAGHGRCQVAARARKLPCSRPGCLSPAAGTRLASRVGRSGLNVGDAGVRPAAEHDRPAVQHRSRGIVRGNGQAAGLAGLAGDRVEPDDRVRRGVRGGEAAGDQQSPLIGKRDGPGKRRRKLVGGGHHLQHRMAVRRGQACLPG